MPNTNEIIQPKNTPDMVESPAVLLSQLFLLDKSAAEELSQTLTENNSATFRQTLQRLLSEKRIDDFTSLRLLAVFEWSRRLKQEKRDA